MYDSFSSPSLQTDSFVIQTDASRQGIAVVLNVVRDDLETPFAFFSRKLKPAETKYDTTELEELAIVSATKHFSVYLYGR